MQPTHIRTSPHPELPYIHVDYKGQRYKVEVFQELNGTPKSLLRSSHCPWQQVARHVIEYLDQLAQEETDFELTPDVFIDVEIGKAPSGKPVPIRQVRCYSNEEDAEVIDEEVIQRTNQAMYRQLHDLNLLMHFPNRPPAPTIPWGAFREGDPLPELAFPHRKYPHEPRLPAFQRSYHPSYYPNQLLVETGGGGDCGASALADAHFQFSHHGFSSKQEWNRALNAQKTFLREETSQYLYETIAADDATMNSSYFAHEILPNILNNRSEIARILTVEQRQAFDFLLNKAPDSLKLEEKSWLTRCYACYNSRQGVLLEEPFLRAYAIQHHIPIAVITSNQIQRVIPASIEEDLVPQIQPGAVLFLHGEDLTHYRSVNCAYPQLNDLIENYNRRTLD